MKIALEGEEVKVYEFNLLQAVKIGKQVEEQGIAFYESLLRSLRERGAREAIIFLLSEEKEHLAVFEREINELSKHHEDGFEGDDIASFLDTRIFSPYVDKQDLEKIISDRKAALTLGKIIERRSISFYETCVKVTEELRAKDAFAQIVGEERKHLRTLEELG